MSSCCGMMISPSEGSCEAADEEIDAGVKAGDCSRARDCCCNSS